MGDHPPIVREQPMNSVAMSSTERARDARRARAQERVGVVQRLVSDRSASYVLGVAGRVGIAVDIGGVAALVFFGEWGSIQGLSCAYLLFAIMLRACSLGSRDPVLFVFWAWSLVYMEIPAVLHALSPDRFRVDTDLAASLRAPSGEVFALAIVFLATCYVAVVGAAAVSIKARGHRLPALSAKRAAMASAFLLAASLSYDWAVTWILPVMAAGPVRFAVETIKLLSYDLAIAMFWACCFTSWRPGESRRPHWRCRTWIAVLAIIAVIHTANGSKGISLIAGFMMVVIPTALALHRERSRVVVPRMLGVVMALALAIPIFALGTSARIWRNTAFVEGFEQRVVAGDPRQQEWGEWVVAAGQRVSITFLRYVAIFDWSEARSGPQDPTSGDIADYLGKSAINLVLPGTAFEEAYTPSSSVLEPLLAGQGFPVNDREEYRQTLNSQPWTIFGVGIAVLGWAAPLGLFCSVVCVRWAVARGGSVGAFFGIMLAYSALSSYGIEVAIQLALSSAATFGVLWWWSRRGCTVPAAPGGASLLGPATCC